MAALLETLTVPRPSGFPVASLSLRRTFLPESTPSNLKIHSFRSSGSLRFRSKFGRTGGRIVCEAQETAVQVLPVVDDTWQSLVLDSETPVLVEFWAPWCGPCRMIHPVIDEIAKEYTGKLKCYKVNTDESPGIATKYGIRSIPTVMVFKAGEKKDAVVGAVPKLTLCNCIEKFL